MRKTRILMANILLVAAILLSACATPTPEVIEKVVTKVVKETVEVEVTAVPEEPEPVMLRIAWWGSQNRHDRTIAAIELFQEQHPNIKITYEYAGWGDYWTRMTTQAAGGNLPDVMQQDYQLTKEWSSRDLLLPLDDYVDSGVLDFTNVADASLAGGRIDGKLYAVNLGNNSQCWVLDADAFEKAGVELPPQDWTWTDFEEITLELHEKLGIWGMGAGVAGGQIWKSLYLGYGDWAWADDGTELGYTDDQPLKNLMKMLLRLQDAGAIPNQEEEAEFSGQGVEAQAIVPGNAAMAYIWSNQIVAVWTAAGEDRHLKLTHLPRPEGGQSSNYVKPSMFWSMTTHSKHPKEAAVFIDWFTNSVEANRILLAERGVPLSSIVREELKPLLGPAQVEMFDFLSRVEADSSPIRPPDPEGAADIINNIYFPEFVQPVLFGLISPEEGVALLREMASPILAANK